MTTKQGSELDVETLSALGQLIAGVAHKLNNSLTSVRGYTDLIHEDLHDLASEDERATPIAEEADMLKTEVHNAARVISLLADFGRTKGVRAVEDPSVLLDGVVSLAGYGLQRAGCAIAIEADPGLPILTESAMALRRILLFTLLLSHRALEDRAKGSRLHIRMQALPGDSGVRVCLTHNGAGAPDDEATRNRINACMSLAETARGRFTAAAGTAEGQTIYTCELPA
jgi:two-component system NtrC family sensor kinase